MAPVNVVEGDELAEQSTEMRLAQDDDMVQHLAAYAADPSFCYRICQGDRYSV